MAESNTVEDLFPVPMFEKLESTTTQGLNVSKRSRSKRKHSVVAEQRMTRNSSSNNNNNNEEQQALLPMDEDVLFPESYKFQNDMTSSKRGKRRLSLVDQLRLFSKKPTSVSSAPSPQITPIANNNNNKQSTTSKLDQQQEEEEEEGVEFSQRPFQLIAMDALFHTLSQSIDRETLYIELLVKQATELKKIENPTKETYNRLRLVKTELDIFKNRLLAIRKAANDFFLDENELMLMSFDSIIDHFKQESNNNNLAWLPYIEDKTEAENITENLIFFLDDKISKLKQSQSFVDSANTNLVLNLTDTNNGLLRMVVMIQAVTAGAAISAVYSALFGMNLYSGLMVADDLNTSNFWTAFGIIVAFIPIPSILLHIYSKRTGLLDLGVSGQI
jgi:hypothetical protein